MLVEFEIVVSLLVVPVAFEIHRKLMLSSDFKVDHIILLIMHL